MDLRRWLPCASDRSRSIDLNQVRECARRAGADLGVMERDARRMRGERPFVFTSIRAGAGVQEVVAFVRAVGGLA
jgi:urease accessory protein